MACSKHPDKYLGHTRSAAERSLPAELSTRTLRTTSSAGARPEVHRQQKNIVPHMHCLELMFTDNQLNAGEHAPTLASPSTGGHSQK